MGYVSLGSVYGGVRQNLHHPALTLAEQGTYTVQLNAQPSGPVTVEEGNVTVGGVPTPESRELKFSTTMWNTVQIGTGTLTHGMGGASEYTGLATPARPSVTVTDNDEAAVTVDTDLAPRTRDLTFTAGDWQTAQPVTGTAAADLNGVDEWERRNTRRSGSPRDGTGDGRRSAQAAYSVRLATQPTEDMAVRTHGDHEDMVLQAAG